MQVAIRTEMWNGRDFLLVEVKRGPKRPYYLASKGPVPSGVFVRHGACSLPASEDAILQMIRESAGMSFESEVSSLGNLTFEYAKSVFDRLAVEFDEMHFRSLGIVDEYGAFTNLGLLISDQCPFCVKFAVFNDETRTEFLDRKILGGSLFQQLDDTFACIATYNNVVAKFEGMYREDRISYPEIALRESLLNAFVHREYAVSASIQVSITPKNLRIASPGGLAPGINYSDLGADISVTRNKRLADMFYRLKLIEVYGTGIPRMIASYKDIEDGCRFEVTDNTFTAVLKNRNAQTDEMIDASKPPKLSESEAEAFRMLQNGARTREQLEFGLGVSTSTALRILDKLQKTGLVVRKGTTRGATYLPASNSQG
jgi:ATP-dependent DNA helicase RecG